MREKLLQFIWQFQYFNKNELATTSGEPLQIIKQGNLNVNQGADFSDAEIKISSLVWAGNIEIHIKTSDWDLHQHSSDKNYGNIILHAVWQHDKEIKDSNGNSIPTLELQSRVPKLLIEKYEALMVAPYFIPCQNLIHSVNEITLISWKHRLLVERLEVKAATIFSYLNKNKFNWEETFWWLLAKNFGVKVNSEAFGKIAQSLPVTLLAKHKNQIKQLEALLFGQAGLLQKDFTDDYAVMLKKEYLYYKAKYNLQQPAVGLFFLRMRPANFPSVRLAQLAMLIHKSLHLFSKIIGEENINNVKDLLQVTANDYWHYHYVFEEISAFKKKNLGTQMINNILINTIIPVLFSFGIYHKEEKYKDKAIQWLEEVDAEKNVITKGFEVLKFPNKNSFDSQAYLQLKNEYCNNRRCLQCALGNAY